jgi:hypothetical protein
MSKLDEERIVIEKNVKDSLEALKDAYFEAGKAYAREQIQAEMACLNAEIAALRAVLEEKQK